MDILQKIENACDALCAIANEMKVANDLKRKEVLSADPEAGKRPMQRSIVVLPDPDEAKAEREQVKTKLTELGIAFPQKAGIERLRGLLPEAETKAAAPDPVLVTGKKGTINTDDVFADSPPVDDLASEMLTDAPAVTLDEVRKKLVETAEAFAAKEPGDDKELKAKAGWAKVKPIVVKIMGTHVTSQMAPEKYGALVMALKAQVAALE